MISELLNCFACTVLWVASKWIVSLVFAFGRNSKERINEHLANMRFLVSVDKRSAEKADMRGNNLRCIRADFEKLRQRTRQGVQNRIYSKTIIFPMILRQRSKKIGIFQNSPEDMSQVPLIASAETTATESSASNMVILERMTSISNCEQENILQSEQCTSEEKEIIDSEYKTRAVEFWTSGKRKRHSLKSVQHRFKKVKSLSQLYDWEAVVQSGTTGMQSAGLPGDTWRYCVERERLAERSELFRAMLVGPLAPAPSDPPPLLQLKYVDKRAFDYLLRYLLDKPINFQSVSTARATLDAAHQYLYPDLARVAVEYLENNLNSNTVLEIYSGISLYANHVTSGFNKTSTYGSPTAPPTPGDEAGKIAAVCTRLLLACLEVIDSDPDAVVSQERFEELTADEVEQLACRDTLRLKNESTLFYALDRWAASECRKHGMELSANNKRTALSDEVWYSVRYPLMTDKEFIEGPMASGILSSEESAFIVAKILGHTEHQEEEFRNSVSGPLSRLSSTPRIGIRTDKDQSWKMSKLGKEECQDNRKNRRKECTSQGQRTCARIGNCLVRVLACIFD